jgi:hypothetical protein
VRARELAQGNALSTDTLVYRLNSQKERMPMSALHRFTGLLLCSIVLTSPASALAWGKGSCSVAHFKSIALRQHQPQLRSAEIEKWLVSHAAACTDAQLATLNANSPLWLGTTLSPDITALIEGAIEAKVAGQPAAMGKLYESLGKEPAPASTVTTTLPQVRAPVVQPSVNNGVISGSVNYGTISQGNVTNQNEIGLRNSNLNDSAGAQVNQGVNTLAQPNAGTPRPR